MQVLFVHFAAERKKAMLLREDKRAAEEFTGARPALGFESFYAKSETPMRESRFLAESVGFDLS